MIRAVVSVLVAWIATMGAAARVHVVSRGDSLSEIAERYQVGVDDLRAWNEIEGDAIFVGQSLAIDGPARDAPGVHRVAAGETLTRIARRHGLSTERLVSLNPGLDPDRLREGAAIVLEETNASESLGEPGAGAIRGAARLGPHRAYLLRDPERAYATRRTIDRLHAAFDALLDAEPCAPRVRVHDLSLRGGGPIDDHRTHQSGRDVDITYFQRRGCGPDGCPLRAVAPDELDARRQWRLLHHWLRRGEIEVVYVDHSLQAALHEEARRRGATEEQLAEWLQYPRPASSPVGLVRHYANHVDHVHVRFACDETEPRCARASHGP